MRLYVTVGYSKRVYNGTGKEQWVGESGHCGSDPKLDVWSLWSWATVSDPQF